MSILNKNILKEMCIYYFQVYTLKTQNNLASYGQTFFFHAYFCAAI